MAQAYQHPAAVPVETLLAECDVERLRRSGPGGQRRNKVETGVRIVHRPTGVRAEATERRSQAENRQAAVFRLRLNLALEVRAALGADWEPSARWRSRCRQGRIAASSGHDDFPAVLAEALDVIGACRYDVRAPAERLDVTASQLVKFLKLEPRALALVNQQRQECGLGRLQ